MPRITRVYTRTGDDGTTALGSGQRVPKSALRLAVTGTVDELSAVLGVVLTTGPTPRLVPPLRSIQNDLLHLGAGLCLAESSQAPRGPRIEPRHVLALERLIDELNRELPPLENFLLPGGTPAAAHLHLARTVCRRVERLAVALAEREPVDAAALAYLNRLSDALFVMARFHNHAVGVPDPIWNSRA